MASVNLTCVDCAPRRPCASCRSIERALRDAGHTVTQTSRYDALRAAIVGRYGFDACVLPISKQERATLDAAVALLPKIRVGVVTEPDAFTAGDLPRSFRLIASADWQSQPFPTDWIDGAGPEAAVADDEDSTRVEPALQAPFADMGTARRRLKTLATRAQRELGVAGFADDRLDPLAALEDEIAWAAASASGFGIILTIVPAKANLAPARAERTLAALREIARGAVRTSDAIAQGRESLLFILPDAPERHVAAVAARIANRIRRAVKDAKTEKALARSFRHVTIGVSAYPAHGLSRETLLARATASAKPVLSSQIPAYHS
jgi:hypothetical protein